MKYLDKSGNQHNRLIMAYISDAKNFITGGASRITTSIKNKKDNILHSNKSTNDNDSHDDSEV
jgi:hypothetical protein